jgi:sortase A
VFDVPVTSSGQLPGLPEPVPGLARTRATRLLASFLILAGLLVLLDGTITLLWQEPITALIASLRQDHLSGELRTVEGAHLSAAEERHLQGIGDERRRIAYLASRLQVGAPNGSAVGRIIIPRISADFVVVNGTDTSDLESGPGVYSAASFPGTGFPGTGRTTAIAGHRTTYLAPFRDINELNPGEHILLYMPYGHFTYTVIGQRVVLPGDVSAAIANFGYSRLVLSACTPRFSAAKRLLVYARLTRVVPVGEARLLGEGQLPTPIETPLRPHRKHLPAMLKSLDPDRVASIV